MPCVICGNPNATPTPVYKLFSDHQPICDHCFVTMVYPLPDRISRASDEVQATIIEIEVTMRWSAYKLQGRHQ